VEDVPCALAGMAGLGGIVIPGWNPADEVGVGAIVIGGVLFLLLGGLTIYAVRFAKKRKNPWMCLYIHLPMQSIGITAIMLIYADLVLGFTTRNISGTPEGGNTMIFIIYFVLKRVPMLTTTF
jgi:hypothetical protein